MNDIYPEVISDISSWKLFHGKNQDMYCVGSIEKDKFIQVPGKMVNEVMSCIAYFDGNNSIQEIQQILKCEKFIKMDVRKFYLILCKADLIVNNKDSSIVTKQELEKLSFTLFRIPLTRIHSLISKLEKNFFVAVACITAIIIFVGILLLIFNYKALISTETYSIANSYFISFILSFLIYSISVFIHELSHAITACRFNLKPKELVGALYLGFTPMVYLKIPGLYTISERKRILVWSAGIYMNMVIASLCSIIGTFSHGDLKNVLIITAVLNIGLVTSNLSPLLPLDGYFIMSTLLKTPNLRRESFFQFKKWITRKKNKFSGIFVIYFFATTIFIAGFLLSQFYLMFAMIIESYQNDHNILRALSKPKYIYIILLMISIRITVQKVLVKRNESKKTI